MTKNGATLFITFSYNQSQFFVNRRLVYNAYDTDLVRTLQCRLGLSLICRAPPKSHRGNIKWDLRGAVLKVD